MTELVTAKKSKGEVLVFRRGHRPGQFREGKGDTESGPLTASERSAIAPKIEPDNESDKHSGALIMDNVLHWR